MRVRTRLLAVVFLALAGWLIPGSPVLAKGPVDKITLTGPGLTNPIEITDPESLAPFNPWTRGFIDWGRGLVTEPPPAEQTYTVSLYLRARGVIYVLQYSPDPSGGPGYLYIPGRGDPWYSLNIGTILTGDSDAWNPNGKWQYATSDWDALMQRALREDRGLTGRSDSLPAEPVTEVAVAAGTPVPIPMPASLSTNAITIAKLWVLALAAVGLLTVATGLLWLRHRQKPT